MSQVPEQFSMVVFDNPRTWHNALLSEWMAMRAEIAPHHQARAEFVWSDEYTAIRDDAFRQLVAEEANQNRVLGDRISSRQIRRINQLVKRSLVAKGIRVPASSAWAIQFMRNSEWLDRIEVARNGKSPDDRVICILADICLQADRDRKQLLHERRASIGAAKSRDSGFLDSHGKYAFLPYPIELLQIRRLARLFMAHIKAGAIEAEKLKLKADPFGAAFPCPKCRKKHETIVFAEHCCGLRYESDLRASLKKAIPIKSTLHLQEVRKFMKLLWQYDYAAVPQLLEIETWPDWEKLTTRATGESEMAFLGFLFNAEPETIRRCLTSGRLSREYAKYNIPQRYRDYQALNRIGAPAMLQMRGWYRSDEIMLSGQSRKPRGRVVVRW